MNCQLRGMPALLILDEIPIHSSLKSKIYRHTFYFTNTRLPNRSGSGSVRAELGGSARFGGSAKLPRTSAEPKTLKSLEFGPFFLTNCKMNR